MLRGNTSVNGEDFLDKTLSQPVSVVPIIRAPNEVGALHTSVPSSANGSRTGWLFIVLTFLLFDLVFVKGYQFGIEDHNFYLPQLQAELDPSLYPDSTAIFRSTSEFSLFNPLFAAPARYLGLEWTFLLVYLALSASFYLVCFLLAEKISGNRLVAYGFLLLMLPLTSVPGTATKVWDSYLIHRGVVLPLCLLAVYQILNRRYVLSYLLFGLSALIHPITAATFAAACAGAVAYDLWHNYISPRVVLLAGGALFVGASPLIWKLLTSAGESMFFSSSTPEWVAIVRERAPYMLPSSWSLGLWSRGAWFLLFLLAWLAKPARRREDAVVMAVAAGCGVLLTVSMVVGSVIPFLPVARFEFARSLLIVILFARLYLAAAFVNGITNGSSWERTSATLGVAAAISLYGEYLPPLRVGAVICAVVALLVLRFEGVSNENRRVLTGGLVVLGSALLGIEFLGALGLLPGPLPLRWLPGDSLALGLLTLAVLIAVAVFKSPSSRTLAAACSVPFCLAYVSYASPGSFATKTVHLPGAQPATPWIQAQLWAKEHTARDAVFLVPWKKAGFPVFSQRSIVGDWKSGGDVKFSPVFAHKWWEWRSDLGGFDGFDTEEFCRLNKKYQFHYIVTEKTRALRFPVIYENQEFSIYRYVDDICQ